MIAFLRRTIARFRNRRFDDELAEELRFHEEQKRQALEAAGLDPEEARARARRTLGNTTLAREEARRVWIPPKIDSIVQDVRYAVRSLARQPAHSLTAGTALVLGIGLNSALFAIFNAIALDPWPVRDPGRIARVLVRSPANARAVGPSVDEYRFMRDHARSFSGLVAYTSPGNGARIRAAGRPELYIHPVWTSANVFDVFGVRMALGSGFIAEDDETGNRRAPIVISHALWRTYFTSDPSVVGQAVRLGSTTATVVGVVEPRFDSLGSVVDAWMPLSALSAAQPQASLAWEPSVKSGNCCIGMAGRLAPGVAARTAGEELQLLHERFAAGGRGRAGRVAVFGTAGISGPGAARYALFGVFGAAVLLVLVLACANVGNLQLARGLARRREIATRMSIGASRGRIVRQLLTEGLVLAGAAGALAVALAAALPPLVFRIIDEEIPPHMASRLAPGWEVGLFTAAICVAACMVFALAPALQATRLTIPLGAIDRASTRSTRLPLRALLLATQIAVCTVLLAGAGLVTRAIAHAMRFDPGFAVQGVEIVSATLPTDGYTPGQRSDFAGQILAAIESSGGEPVALASHPPINRAPFVMPVTLPHEGPRDLRSIRLRQVSSGYFDVLGIPVAAGRMFGPRPSDEAVVNETLARALWPGESAIGRIVNHVDRAGKTLRAYTIVGVVRDAHLTSLEQVEGTIFTPARSGMFLTRGGPEAVERIRAAALAISPSAVVATRPLTDELRNYLVQSRAGAALAWAIGLLGLTLAIVGVFGVFAYAVEERRREIGVRMALGAAGPQILRMLAATSGRAMISGLAAGLVVSLACGPLLRSYLYGLSPLDPGAYALVAAILAGAGVLATFIPARRACRIDPAVTLRAE